MKFILCVLVFAGSFAAQAEQLLTFGRYNSRAIFNAAGESESCRAPLVILVPGSGANGPEEMVPGLATGDGKDHSIFAAYSEGLRRGGVGTLAIGKPGIEFFRGWDTSGRFYDANMYKELGWQDLVNNLSDAVAFAKTLPCVDPARITVLGHSEGTQVAADFAKANPAEVRSLILVGFAGESLAETVDWQFYRRATDVWLRPDVDTNHDEFISKAEASVWPEFLWDWKGQDNIALADIESTLRADPAMQKEYQRVASSKIYAGVFDRPAIYEQVAQLPQSIFVFTGEYDVQTRPEEAMKMREALVSAGKVNFDVQIVPGLTHGMSELKGPRKQRLLDSTLAPVAPEFLTLLETTAARL